MTDLMRETSESLDVGAEAALRVEKAASYVGHASAMVVNLYATGRGNRADVWVAERDAWAERQADLIEKMPLDRQRLARYAAGTISRRFKADTAEPR